MNSKNFFKIFFDNINPTNLDKLTDVNFYYENICKKLKEKNLYSILLSKIISEIFNDNNELFLKKYFEDENLIKDILTMENNNNNVNNYEEEENKNINVFQYFKDYYKEIKNNKSNNKEIINILL